MKRILIISGGDFAAKVIRLINRIGGYVVIGYTDIVDRGSLFGVKHLGTDREIPDLIKKHPGLNAVLCIGVETEHRDKRKVLINDLNKHELQMPALISPNAFIEEDVEIGSGSVVFDNTLIDFGSGTVQNLTTHRPFRTLPDDNNNSYPPHPPQRGNTYRIKKLSKRKTT